MMGINSPLLLGLSFLLLIHNHCYCHASPIEFTVHHRFSDPVKAMFPVEEGKLLPEEGTTEYLTAMVANDHHLIHGRRFLASNGYKTPVTFVRDNKAYLLTSFGYMYYANVSVGTPEKTFLVALDTESNYFWLPCECTTCSSVTNNGTKINIEVYDLSSSSTGVKAPCDSSLCDDKSSCSKSDGCPYESKYGTNSSSLGYLVEDVLHLATDSTPSNKKFSKTTFGCGQKQSGDLLEGSGSNGVLGLGWDKTSIPSILASEKLVADSFSMCFSSLGTSRISFGDKGSSKQFQTPLTEGVSFSTYSVSMNQLSVETTTKEVDAVVSFNMRIFFTYMMDPLYTFLTENIDSHITEKKLKVSEDFPLQYCYSLSSCSSILVPSVNITFKGGYQYQILRPGEFFESEDQCYYCLTFVKATSMNAIGSNHMKGHRIVFDREDKVLGWEQSDCKYEFDSTSTPTDDDTSSPNTKENSPPSKGQENSTPMVIPTTTIGYLLSSLTFVFLLSLIMP